MKSYPSITTKSRFDLPAIVFDKLDGSNIRAEWSKKKGFYKFGTRNRLVDVSDPLFGGAPGLIQEKYSDALSSIATKQRWERAVFFFEFFGPNSFAGNHEDEEHDVVLFDVSVYRKGFIPPREFIELFEWNVDTPVVLKQGNVNAEFIELVRTGMINNLTFEGVVCKMKHPKLGTSISFKIKTLQWLAKLKSYCGNDEAQYMRLL